MPTERQFHLFIIITGDGMEKWKHLVISRLSKGSYPYLQCIPTYMKNYIFNLKNWQTYFSKFLDIKILAENKLFLLAFFVTLMHPCVPSHIMIYIMFTMNCN